MLRTLLCCALLGGCATTEARFPSAGMRTFSQKGEYIVGPGDVLTVMPSDSRETTTNVVVSPGNAIQLPFIGEVATAGQTLAQLSEAISKRYAQYYKKTDFLVNVAEVRSYRSYVIGEVRTAGEYQLGARTTVLGILAKAGGQSDFATGKITLIRREAQGTSSYEFSYKALLDKESKMEPVYVERDDIILVH